MTALYLHGDAHAGGTYPGRSIWEDTRICTELPVGSDTKVSTIGSVEVQHAHPLHPSRITGRF